MKNLTIGKRITGGFAAVILLTAALGAFCFNRTLIINDRINLILSDCMPGVYYVSQIEANIRTQYAKLYEHAVSTEAVEKRMHHEELMSMRAAAT